VLNLPDVLATSLEAAAAAVVAELAEDAVEQLRAKIWFFRFLAAAASCSFCSCAWVLGGAEMVRAVLATLLQRKAGGRGVN
jgi:crotonobetainyl-CoA:carnitine CoA-transferase CaiB-like acyl-CoA transferase